MFRPTLRASTACFALLTSGMLLAACGDEPSDRFEGDPVGATVDVPATYAFESRFVDGASSVAYSGQTYRHVLIDELNAWIAGMGDAIDGGSFQPAADGDVVASLDFYFRFDSASNGSTGLTAYDFDLPLLQGTFDDISSDKDLVGKLAGNDSATDHMDWSTAFGGWSDASIAASGGSIDSPEGLVLAFFETLEDNAIGRAEGTVRQGPDGAQLPVYVTETGLDLRQLTQKFLLMAVTFSQAADDYLDDDTDGKGLLAPNTQDGDNAYSTLEHQWDEGFGYFGASIDYSAWTDAAIADGAVMDLDGDGSIDLGSEVNFGASTNAAKRDAGATVATDFTAEAFAGFRTGRAIIAAAGDTLTDDEMAALMTERDRAIGAWESAIAATVVHYINDTLGDMDAMGTDDYSFTDHAKHWSELKGFALGFQFNPRSPLSDADFAQFHQLVGDAPVLESAGAEALDAYRADLLAARDLLQTAYGFDPQNVENW